MSSQFFQRLSVRFFSACRRGLERLGDWAHASPRVARWVFAARGDDTPEARYSRFNGRYFANFHEQEKMLADQQRMKFYHAAITRHIKPGARVIDLGTGTGILAAFAARTGAAKVYAIDHSAILKHAKRLAVENQIPNVEFVALHSSAFKLEERVDVILHEQMGDFLFDESMVANVCDLRDRLLKPGGLILPSRFEFFCEPMKVRDERHIPLIWELNVYGFDYSGMERSRPQEPEYYRLGNNDLGVVEHFLGTPAPLLEFDLHTMSADGPEREITFSRRVEHAGRMDGYAVFFRAKVDEDLVLGTGPLDAERAPHWAFRILRTDREDFEVGDVIAVTLKVGRWADPDSWRWSQVKQRGGMG